MLVEKDAQNVVSIQKSISAVARRVAQLPGAAWLDDANGWSIFVWGQGPCVPASPEWPKVARRMLRDQPLGQGPSPFVSGLLGYVSYEAGRFTEHMRPRHRAAIPEIYLRRYDGSLSRSPLGEWHIAGSAAFCDEANALLDTLSTEPTTPHYTALSPPSQESTAQSRARYTTSVNQVLEHLRAGDSYQVNLAHRVRLDGALEGIEAALTLRAVNPAPFGAYVALDDGRVVLSNSPELFLRVRGATLESEPIKGTASCRQLGVEGARKTLEASAKDQAELTMIVDLVRNDLGKVAKTATVKVGPRCVERVGPVMHASRLVSAELRPDRDAIDAFTASFPPGSVTGAPKVRSMEIIDALEPVARGVYTGAIGYFADGGDAAFNVAIRTGVVGPKHTEFHIGAGIVIESEAEAEWDETHAKGEAWLEALAGKTEQR